MKISSMIGTNRCIKVYIKLKRKKVGKILVYKGRFWCKTCFVGWKMYLLCFLSSPEHTCKLVGGQGSWVH